MADVREQAVREARAGATAFAGRALLDRVMADGHAPPLAEWA
jgi:hypothetical protein